MPKSLPSDDADSLPPPAEVSVKPELFTDVDDLAVFTEIFDNLLRRRV